MRRWSRRNALIGARTPASAAASAGRVQRRQRIRPEQRQLGGVVSAAPRVTQPKRRGSTKRSSSPPRQRRDRRACEARARSAAAWTRSRPVIPRWTSTPASVADGLDQDVLADAGCTARTACTDGQARPQRRAGRPGGAGAAAGRSSRPPRCAAHAAAAAASARSSRPRAAQAWRRPPRGARRQARRRAAARAKSATASSSARRVPAIPLAASAAVDRRLAERRGERPPQHLAPGRERLLDDRLEQRRIAHRRQRRRAAAPGASPTRSPRARDETSPARTWNRMRASACCATITDSRP